MWTLVTALMVVLRLAASPVTPSPPTPPTVELYTMGPGDDVFSQFGHAAVCIHDQRHPAGRCFNYGTTDFSRPLDLIWDVLRGRGQFWVSETNLDRMLGTYQADDRTVYRQLLPLTAEEAQEAARLFAHDAEPAHRGYTYHHFRDNCSTRLRDHLDAVTHGRLAGARAESFAGTYREIVRQGFAGDLGLLTLSDVILGRATDRRPSRWDAMFLPDVLRAEVADRLGSPAEIVFERRTPLRGSDPHAGLLVFFVAAGVLALLQLLALASGRPWLRRAAFALGALVVGGLALVVDGVALVSVLRELRLNELLVVFVPTDLVVPFLGAEARTRYARARIALLAVVALLAAAGLLIQPLWGPIALVAAVFAPLLLSDRRPPARRLDAGSPPLPEGGTPIALE